MTVAGAAIESTLQSTSLAALAALAALGELRVGGTMIYVADVTFKKKSVHVTPPKDGRTMRSSKIAGVCEKAVKDRADALSRNRPRGRRRSGRN